MNPTSIADGSLREIELHGRPGKTVVGAQPLRMRANLRDYWSMWLEAAGCKALQFSQEITCNSLATTIQAAMDGLGIALARNTVTKEDLPRGRLTEPFDVRLPCTAEGYYVVTFPELADLQKVKAFRSWILATFLNSQRVRSRSSV